MLKLYVLRESLFNQEPELPLPGPVDSESDCSTEVTKNLGSSVTPSNFALSPTLEESELLLLLPVTLALL